jgi:type I restriction enzyme S subunit
MKTMNPDWLLKHFEQIGEAPDAVPRLRRFVLDLAVRGKLVEQDPIDEPASELLSHIQLEKQQILARGRTQNQDLSSIEEREIPFVIPTNWTWVRLGEVIKLWNGFAFKSSDYKQQGVPVIRIGDLQNGQVVLDSVVFVDENVAASVDESVWVPENALLIAMSGATTGKVAFNRTGKRLLLNQRVGRVQVFSVHHDFLRFFFETIVQQNLSISLGTAIPNLSTKQIYETAFPLPPQAEQHRIVAKVDELMALCGELEAAQAKRDKRRDRLVAATLHGLNNGRDVLGRDGSPSRPLVSVDPRRPQSSSQNGGFDETALSKSNGALGDSALPLFFLNYLPRLTTRPEHIHQLRQTILNLAVRGRLVPQDPRDEPVDSLIAQIQAERKQRASKGGPTIYQISSDVNDVRFPVPQSWKWVRLGVITNVLMGQSPPGETYNTRGEGIVLINGPVEFSEGPFGISVLNQYTTAPTKLCKKGDLLLCVRGSTTGRTNVAGADACIGRGVAALQPLYADQFVRLFIWSWREQIIDMGRGIAFPSISRRQIEDLPIPFPPLAEQHRIVAKVDELMALCDEMESRLTINATTRRQLLEATLQEALSRQHSLHREVRII